VRHEIAGPTSHSARIFETPGDRLTRGVCSTTPVSLTPHLASFGGPTGPAGAKKALSPAAFLFGNADLVSKLPSPRQLTVSKPADPGRAPAREKQGERVDGAPHYRAAHGGLRLAGRARLLAGHKPLYELVCVPRRIARFGDEVAREYEDGPHVARQR
jgi:hypothetical protein